MSAEEPPAISPRRGPERRTAVVAVAVLAVLAVAAVLAVTLSGGGKHKAPVAAPSAAPATSAPPPPSPAPSPTPSADPQTFAYIALHTGDCVSDPSFTSTVDKLVKRACTAAHDAEVTGREQLPDGLSTGLAISEKAKAVCKATDDTAWHKQGARADSLNLGAYFPSPANYKAGRHTATCILEIGFRASKLRSALR
jgi:hypothetical protein